MASFTIRNPKYDQTVRTSFEYQGLMKLFGAELLTIEPGHVAIKLPYQGTLTQQQGFIHGGVVTSIVDSACGYAALTLMPPNHEVLAVEFKVNFLTPAAGEYLIAHGYVVKPGRTLTICRGEVMVQTEQGEKICALMQATMIAREAI